MVDFQSILANSFYWGFSIALIASIIYFWNHKTAADFLKVASIVIVSQAAVGGPIICIKALMPSICNFSSPEKRQVFIGGMAVAWNAMLSLVKIVAKPKVLS